MKNIYMLIAIAVIIATGCKQTSSTDLPESAAIQPEIPARIKLVSEKETGEPLIISGIIYLPDGKTPARGAILSVWHTDAEGYYNQKRGQSGEKYPRIHGRMVTGNDGRYEFVTIKPGSYPSGNLPAHIHAHVSAPDFPEYGLTYFFEGDRFITVKNRTQLNSGRGGTPSIIELTRDANGTLIGHRDIILEYVKPDGETMNLTW